MMVTRVSVEALPTDARSALLELVALALAGSGFRSPKVWPFAIAIIRREEKRTTSRADFGQWARANDLGDVANQCMRTKTRPGEILAWLEVDVPGIAVAGFVVVPLAKLLGKSEP